MTTTSVKDVSSLVNLVNSAASKAKSSNISGSGTGFKEFMSQTAGGGTKTSADSGAALTKQNDLSPSKTGSDLNKQKVQTSSRDVKRTEKDITNASEMNEKSTEDALKGLSEEEISEIGEKASELLSQMSSELDISEQDIVEAMENMGITPLELLNPEVMTQVVLEITGEEDAISLLTNEDLMNSLQNLKEFAEDSKVDLLQEFQIPKEELEKMLSEASTQTESAFEGSLENAVSKEADKEPKVETKITVEVSGSKENITFETDAKGNVVNVVGNSNQEENGGQALKGGKDEQSESNHEEHAQMLHSGTDALNALLQDRSPIQEIPEEPVVPTFTQQTTEIMDQILDHMKISLKPDMDQLEMQLHPASLGTVQVQITSRGGELTAQFQVQNETVRAAMESQMADLKETLQNQGVKVEAIEVSIGTSGFESNLWKGEDKESNQNFANQRRSPRRINLSDWDTIPEELQEEDVLAAEMMKANGNTVDYTA